MLQDTGAVLDWFKDNARRYGLDPGNHSLRPWIIAAADCALDVGMNPGGLFVYLLRELARGDSSRISGERYDRAKLRLRDITPDISPDMRHILEGLFLGNEDSLLRDRDGDSR